MATAPYRVVVDPQLDGDDVWRFRGETLQFFGSRAAQSILAGPSDTGKTVACCVKLHLACLRCARSQHAMIRKVYNSMASSVCQTFGRIIAGAGVAVLGSDSPRLYTYPNGSQVWVGGMDNPDKSLSSERDSIMVNQSEQLTLQDWEMLSSRCTGRAAVMKFPQLYGDCNPAGSLHWIRDAAKRGKLEMFAACHKDNPTLYSPDGNVLLGAQKRLDALSNLTGVRRKRLFEGVWATSEGAVYDNFDAAIHVVARPISDFKRFYLAIDEGYTNPAVVLLVGEDGDGRWHVLREFYQTGQLQETVVRLAKQWLDEFRCEVVAVDAAAAGLIADLNAVMFGRAKGGKGRVLDGINRVQNRLNIAGDGKPRLTFDPACVNCVNEFESYCWRPEKDVPVKEHDHCSDAIRYLGDVLGEGTGAFADAAGFRAGVTIEGREQFTSGRIQFT